MKEILSNFIQTRLSTFEKGTGLCLTKLNNQNWVIKGDRDERIGSWVERYKADLSALASEHNFDVTAIIEKAKEPDSEALVYVLFAAKGDTTGLDEIKRIEANIPDVYYYSIDQLPDLDNFINWSSLSMMLLEKSAEIYRVKEY